MAPPAAASPPLLLLLFLLLARGGAAVGRPAFACDGGATWRQLPFCRRELPIPERVRDLIGRLRIDEKVRLLANNAAAVPRLGIGRYEWWSEALHGVSNSGPGVRFGGEFPAATSFPQVISSAASFNATLWELIGRAVSDEARAMYNGGHAGLTLWSPNVNIFRDPRWGRGQETPGEDPALSARYAAAYVRGLQEPYGGERRLKVAACCKHFTAYDMDHWRGHDRFHFDARVSRQDLEDTFNVPFRSCVADGGAAAVMCSYNKVNGVPACADPALLRDTLRHQYSLDGYIVSDCDSVGVFYNDQHYTSTPEDAAADAIKAGLDLDCGPFLAQHTESALRKGKLQDSDIDAAVTNTVAVQMRLGMFDGDPSGQHHPFSNLGAGDVCSRRHQDLALEAARQSIVLLKNSGALPLNPSRIRTIAVVGPHAAATAAMIGNYAGVPCRYTTPLDGIRRYAGELIHEPGCTDIACSGADQPIGAAVEAARRADAVVIVVGLDQSVESEGKDREGLLLPGRQSELVARVAAAASRVPAVLVLMCGGPVDVSAARDDPNVAAILWIGYPGEAGGAAIAGVLFGEFSPAGRLPVTWYPHGYVEKVPMTTMAMRANPATGYPGRSYRFYEGPVVFPFGHGLAYTWFSHAVVAGAPARISLQLQRRRSGYLFNSTAVAGRGVKVAHVKCAAVEMTVEVSNVGGRDGEHVLLVFAVPPAGRPAAAPKRQLVGFEKVFVAAESRAGVDVAVDVCRHLSYVDSDGVRRIAIGEHTLHVGDVAHSVAISVE